MTSSSYHPLVALRPDAVLEKLDQLVARGIVKERVIEGKYSIFKYNDAKKIEGLARLARGLLMERSPVPRYINLPMPKFEEVAPFRESVEEYHQAVREALPERLVLQPKHDGTCIHAVCREGVLRVNTFVATDSAQALRAQELLAKAEWDDGVTYAFELIDAADPKVQEKRVADGLYLFYACTSDGRFLSRDELNLAASRLGVALVKQQPASRDTVMAQLKRMDAVASAEEAIEGMIALIDGKRVKIKSHVYLVLSTQTKPSRRWLKTLVGKSKTLDALHENVEAYEGCLDLPARARRLLVDLLAETRATVEAVEANECTSAAEINAHPNALKLRSLLFDKIKGRFDASTDEGLFRIISFVANKFD